ncbi:MAG: hypothetical protein ACRD3D_06315 [Terriglobia bacterium]
MRNQTRGAGLFIFSCCLLCAAFTAVSGAAATARLGHIHFPISCGAAAQADFDAGVALLHSFQYDEATQAFHRVAGQDSHCAMAYWGLAMSLYQQLWGWPSDATLRQGEAYVKEAQRRNAKTKREREYVAAAAAFYQPEPNLSHLARAQAYSKALAQVYRDNPDDVNAAAFYALSLVALAQDGGKDLANRKQAIAILNPWFARDPDNPGVDHYLIHASDTSQLARYGLAAARNYARIAPGSAHALHMPSHIFTRLGYWQDSIRSNIASAAAAEQATQSGRDNEWQYQVHALSFLEYAYLQSGRQADARRVIDEVKKVPGASKAVLAENQALFEATYDVENHHWGRAAALAQPPGKGDRYYRIEIYWARTVGAARAGKLADAREDFRSLNAAYNQTHGGANKQSNSPEPGRSVMQLEAEAWLEFAEGRRNAAVDTLRKAADKEDAAGVDSLTMPAREMLGDMLLELHQPAPALTAYEVSLSESPERFDALEGAALAADFAGSTAKTRSYYVRLVKSCGPEADREEYREARIFLAKN